MIYRLDHFQESAINPITEHPYDASWIVWMLTDASYTMQCGSAHGCAYTLKVSRNYPHWKMSLGDFIGYHSSVGKNLLLVLSEADYAEGLRVYGDHSFRDPFLREYESPVLIHSTTQENCDAILKDGCLKSWKQIHSHDVFPSDPIGKLLGDPVELRDYILFGKGVTGEIVVSSKQKNKIEMDDNSPYIPGARLYFDMRKIARDGLLTRDGGEMKVKDRLPLHPYLIWTATRERAGLESECTTPRIFAEKADACFEKLFPQYQQCL